MINVKKLLLKENRDATAEHGCLMAMFPKSVNEKIVKFGKKIIKEEQLYKEGNEFGRETEGHVTIRYGFTKDLNELQIRQLLKNQKSFIVELYGLDKFGGQPNASIGSESKPYDVVYLKAKSDVLKILNEATKKFPHTDSYFGYNPHATIAYIRPGIFQHGRNGVNIKVMVDTICYSPISGGKSYFKLE